MNPDWKARLGRLLGLDVATLFGSFSVIWTVLSGALTLVLIASRFDPDTQGYYYTFGSLVELTVIAELGLGLVIQQFASHEWSFLTLNSSGAVTGDAGRLRRLASLATFSLRWYASAGLLAAAVLGLIGYFFFSYRDSSGIEWRAPWLALCAISGARLLVVPAFSLLDGCDQMRSSNRIRLAASVTASLCAWLALFLGAGLWVPAVMSGTGTLANALLLWRRHGRFFSSLLAVRTAGELKWRAEVWPMQWRIALSWLSGYFIFSLFTPVMFHFHGTTVAGQMGMTLSAVYALQALSLTWVSTRAPRLGILIARREFVALDQLFAFSLKRALGVFCVGAVGLMAGVWGLELLKQPVAARLLGLTPLALFLGSALVTVFVGSLAVYLRAHKKEPFLVLSVVGGALTGLGTVYFGSRYGPTGAAGSYLALSILFLLPGIAIFRHCKARWHRSET
jgi:hypothetical protein